MGQRGGGVRPHKYVNSLDPSRGCTLQAELIVTTSLEPSGSDSGIVPMQWESVVGLPHCFTMPLAWSVVQCLQRCVRPTLTTCKCLDFFIIRSLFEAMFSKDVAKEGR